MKIALLGYGKMGKEIESIAIERGHSIELKINAQNLDELNGDSLNKCDVAIEFSTPDNAIHNILRCFDASTPVIVGTTGWYNDFDHVKNKCLQTDSTLIYATNFSIGVNIFFKLNQQLAKVMNHHKQYQPAINEIHHTQKLDAPSGTAITLGEGIISEVESKKTWVNHPSEHANELEITSERINDVPGTHEITYQSAIDDLSIKHTAHNRKGFALGAVVAAEWSIGKKGIYTMSDVLNVNFS